MINWVMESLTAALFRLAEALIPMPDRNWLGAMRAECEFISDPGDRLRWAAGNVRAALRIRSASFEMAFVIGTGGSLALITVLDWNDCDPTITLVALTSGALALGYLFPRHRLAIGMLYGFWLLAAHVIADMLTFARPFYQRFPLTLLEILQIGAVALVTIPAAQLGGRLTGRWRPTSS